MIHWPYFVAHDEPWDREAWLDTRRKVQGWGYASASEVATILGLNPFQSPEQLLAEKLGTAPPFNGNAHTLRGQCLEDGHIRHWNETGGDHATPWGHLLVSYRYPLAATPDAAITETWPGEEGGGECYARDVTGLIEIKDTTQLWSEPPRHYVIQVQVQLAVTGLDEGWLYANLGDKSYLAWPIAPATEDDLRAWCKEITDFYDRVKAGF